MVLGRAKDTVLNLLERFSRSASDVEGKCSSQYREGELPQDRNDITQARISGPADHGELGLHGVG